MRLQSMSPSLASGGRAASPRVSSGGRERRKDPREVIDAPAKIRFPDDTCFDAVVHDIAPAAVQLRCDRAIALALYRHGLHRGGAQNNLVDIRFPLESKGEICTMEARCEVLYVAMNDRGGVAVGLTFTSTPKRCADFLRMFFIHKKATAAM